jgi:hypothetical protein
MPDIRDELDDTALASVIGRGSVWGALLTRLGLNPTTAAEAYTRFHLYVGMAGRTVQRAEAMPPGEGGELFEKAAAYSALGGRWHAQWKSPFRAFRPDPKL